MVIVIETSDQEAIHVFSEMAKALKVNFRVEPDAAVVAPEERQRRLAVIRKFKGGLKKYFTGYQPDKHDWYQQ